MNTDAVAESEQPFSGIATFGRRPCRRDLTDCDVAVLGIPFDSGTTYRSGARFGPRAIREQSLLLWGYHPTLAVAPFEKLRVIDYGDVNVIPVDIQATHAAIEATAGTIIRSGPMLLAIGGDHSVTLPLLKATAARHGPLAVVHFDAHLDTWSEEFAGHPVSHGTGFRRALEAGVIDRSAYIQVGLRGPTLGPTDYADAQSLGAYQLPIDAVMAAGIDATLAEIRRRVGQRPLYVSLDIDCVDPAFAPGTGTPEVGGLTSWQLQQLLRGLRGLNLVGGDVVEVAPAYDPTGITAILAANLLFEMLALRALRQV